MSQQWFFSQDGAQYGPVDEAEIVRLIQDGELPPGTPVCKEGGMDWQPARAHGCFQVEIYPRKKRPARPVNNPSPKPAPSPQPKPSTPSQLKFKSPTRKTSSPPANTVTCPDCRQPHDTSANFCPACGFNYSETGGGDEPVATVGPDNGWVFFAFVGSVYVGHLMFAQFFGEGTWPTIWKWVVVVFAAGVWSDMTEDMTSGDQDATFGRCLAGSLGGLACMYWCWQWTEGFDWSNWYIPVQLVIGAIAAALVNVFLVSMPGLVGFPLACVAVYYVFIHEPDSAPTEPLEEPETEESQSWPQSPRGKVYLEAGTKRDPARCSLPWARAKVYRGRVA